MKANDFIDSIIFYKNYWQNKGFSKEKTVEGVIYSILCIIDGVTDTSAIDLVHEGEIINGEEYLHDLFKERIKDDN